jgi:hypothetical protein
MATITKIGSQMSDGVGNPLIGPAQAAVVHLTDSSGGTASDTLAAITGSYVEATIENTVASLAAKINAILSALEAHGLIKV